MCQVILGGGVLCTLAASPTHAEQSELPASASQTFTTPIAQRIPTSAWKLQTLTLTAARQSLAEIVGKLSIRLGCAIVVDGEPALTEADFDLHGSAKEVLDSVADKFDYSWKIDKNGVVLLNKRFTSKVDVPQMHLAEMTQMAADFTRLIPDTGLAYNQVRLPLNALYRTFTPDQMALLQDKKQINFTQLSFEQQNLAHLAILDNMFSDGHSQWEHLHDMLVSLPRARLLRRSCVISTIVKRASLPPASVSKPERPHSVVRDSQGHVMDDVAVRSIPGEELVCLWRDTQGQEQTLTLFRQVSSAPPSVPVDISPSNANKLERKINVVVERDSSRADVMDPLPQTPTPVQKTLTAAVGLNANVHLHLGSTTLEHLASAVEDQTGVHIIVPRRLRERQLIVHIDRLDTRSALDALATLNGWHITVFSQKSVQIDQTTVSAVQKLSELPAALSGALPLDFRCYLRLPLDISAGKASGNDIYTDPVTGNQMDRGSARVLASGKAHQAALEYGKELWETLSTQQSDSKTVSYTQLSASQQEQLTGIIVSEGISQIFLFGSRGNNVLYGVLTPFEEDENKANITVEKREILVSTVTVNAQAYTLQAFSESIQSPEKLPDPLRLGRH